MDEGINFRPSKPAKPTTSESPAGLKVRFVGDEIVADSLPRREAPAGRADPRPIEDWGRRPRLRQAHVVPPSALSDLFMALLGIGAIIGWGLLLINIASTSGWGQ